MTSSAMALCANRLLRRLPKRDYERLRPHLKPVDFPLKQVVYEAGAKIDYAYFPNSGVLSALTVMEDGRAIEAASIGFEGATGLPAFLGAEISTSRFIVQVAGEGLRLEIRVLQDELAHDSALRKGLTLYHNAYLAMVSQSVACNGLHPVQKRCCRWLLLTRDRISSDDIPLTHEFLAMMLGVRRPSVTEVLQHLEERGLVRNHRGMVTLVDRAGMEEASCECYRVVANHFERMLN